MVNNYKGEGIIWCNLQQNHLKTQKPSNLSNILSKKNEAACPLSHQMKMHGTVPIDESLESERKEEEFQVLFENAFKGWMQQSFKIS